MAKLPQQNPFENLFGNNSQTGNANKTSNPFEGLFDKQATTQQPETPQLKFEAPKEGSMPAPEKQPSIWIKAARAVLPKSVENFFGISEEAQKRKEFMAQYEEAYATEDLRRLEKQLQEGGGKLPKQTASDVAKETKPETYLPFVSAIPEITSAVQLYQSAKRVEKGEETAVDLYRLVKYKAESERDKTFGAQVASVLTQLPSFGGELLLTGGTYTAGKAATEKAITETLEKAVGKTAGRIISKSAGSIVGGTLQTIPARGLEITAGTIKNMIPDYTFEKSELGRLEPVISGKGDDLWKALAKSGFDQWVEVVTEHSGGLLDEAITPVKNQLLKMGVLKAFLQSNPTAKSADFMKWVNRAGWNGVLGEMFEERVGDVAKGVLTQFGLSEEGWKIPSPQQLAVELVSFSVPGVMIETTNKMLQQGQTLESIYNQPEDQKNKQSISRVDNIIGARDILTVGKGGTDLNADAMAYLQKELENYQEKVAQPVIEILDTDRTPIAQIRVLQYPDGKWAYSYSLNTADTGIVSDFTSNKLVKTRELAVASAKAKLLTYAKQAEQDITPEARAELQTIAKHIERVMPGSDVPIEVRKGDNNVSSKITELVRGYQTYGGYTAGKETQSPYLRDLSTILKTETGQEISRNSIETAMERGEIKADEKGFITLYRVGAVGKLNDLYSATYDKKFAEQFSEANGQPITEFKVMPHQIKYVIGGVEKEVLLENKETKTQKEKVAEAVKAGRQAVAVEKSEKAVEEFIKPRVEEASKSSATLPLNLVSKIFALRDLAIAESKAETPERKKGQLSPTETTFDKELKSLNREFGKEVYKAYKSRYGEYPIGFISLSGCPLEWANEKQGTILFDLAQAETDKIETQVAENVNDILTEMHDLKSRGRSSEIIQSDIQYEVEGTRPQEKIEKVAEVRLFKKGGTMSIDETQGIKTYIKQDGDIVSTLIGGTDAERLKLAKQYIQDLQNGKSIPETIDVENLLKTKPQMTDIQKEANKRIGLQPVRKFSKEKTLSGVEVASKIIPKRPNLPILSELLVKNGEIYATDLEVALRLKTGLKDGMYKIVGKEAIKTDNDPADFPIFPEVKGEPVAKIISENLKNVLKKAVLSSDKNPMRPEIEGVYMRIDGNNVTFASTDGYRMFIKKVPAKISGKGEFILSNPEKVQKVIADVGGTSEITFDDKVVKFSGANGEVVARRVEGEYPKYKDIIPAYEKQYFIDRKQMLDAVKQLKPFTDKRSPRVDFTYKDGKITLVAFNEAENLRKKIVLNTSEKNVEIKEKSENNGVMLMPVVTDTGDISYNIEYLTDTLNSFDEDGIYLYLAKDPGKTASFFSAEKELKSEEAKPKKEISATIETPLPKEISGAKPRYGYGEKLFTLNFESDVDKASYIVAQTNKSKSDEKYMEYLREIFPEKSDDQIRADGANVRKKIKELAKDAEPGELFIEKVEKTKRAPSGMASAGADALGNFEDLAGKPNKTAEEFKLYEEVKGLVQKYAKTIGEDYLPSNALGVYYPETKNIRIKGMNHLSVAAHEITHFLDFSYKISNEIMEVTGYSKNGLPIYSSETSKLRKEMTDLYEKYYPGAKKTHKLRKRMLEGFATLLEKYTEQPTTITAQYPNLVKEFLTPSGKYYKPVMGDIINDLRKIVAKYQGLPALDKVGSRVINDEVNVNKDSFLNFWEKLKTTISDNVYPIEVLAKKAGVHFTKEDPSLWVRQYSNSNALILNNINGNRGFWGWRNGNLAKLHDFNWKDLIKDLKLQKATDEFAYWLVARREHFAFQELKELEKAVKVAKEAVKAANYAVQQAREAGADTAEFVSDVKRVMTAYEMAVENYNNAKSILDKDGFTEQEVTDAYMLNKDRFAEFEKTFDALTAEDLKFLNDQSVGLVSNDEYRQLSAREGYASFKRYFYDEVVGEEEGATPTKMRFGSAKVSSLLKRTGSQKPILNPLYSAMRNHAEITRKGLKQIVYNRIGELAMARPDLGLFQRLELQAIPDRTGKLLFPQEKDPNIVMARLNYKRRPFLTEASIKRTIDEVLNFQNISTFEKLFLGASRFFTKGTTGLFPGFALTNYTVDQLTAAAQTRNKYRVLYDPLKKLWSARFWENKPERVFLQEYMIMGGEKQTFVGWQDMSPNELFDAIQNERKGLVKVIDAVNKGMDILAIPSQWSEIATRATEYIKARQSGKSQVVALEEAGRVTAPFHHIGRWKGGKFGQTYIKSIPFFNPAIQVLTQAAETLETPAGRRQYGFVALATVAASISAFGVILMVGTDDQKKEFADIQPDELNKYIWYPLPGGKGLGKIRVPDQMVVVATLINMMWADKALNANYTMGEYLNGAMSWLPQQFDVSQPIKMFLGLVPQIIKPGFLTIAGVKDFPKIMPLESPSLKNRAPKYRYTDTTSKFAKWLGEKLNWSPIKIDYFIEGYFGRSTRFITGKPKAYDIFTSLSRDWYFKSGRKLQEFYNIREKNNQDYEAYKKGRSDYSFGERTAIIKLRAKINIIESNLDLYGDVDEEKNPEKAKKLRDKILSLINEL